MNSSACSRIRVAISRSTAARSGADMRGHGPSSNARRAAATAASMSAACPSATVAMTSFVVGLSVSNVPPARSRGTRRRCKWRCSASGSLSVSDIAVAV